MSAYLDLTADAATYGIDAAVTAAQVMRASALIDDYLRRPEGLVWSPDYAGLPAYMAGMTPSFSLAASGAIAPGTNVQVAVTGMYRTTTLLGEVVILDRATANKAEACVIVASDATSVTLDKVALAHNAGAVMDAGLVIVEERQMPSKRSITRVSRPNFVRLMSLQGRYGYGRRSDQMSGTFNEVNLLATLSTFGGPPQWVPVDIGQVDTSPQTGELWVPAGMMLAYYTDVRIRYVAGFPITGLPPAIKIACAQIANGIAASADYPGAWGSIRAGDTEIKRQGMGYSNAPGPRRVGAGITDLTPDVKASLDPFRVRAMA